MALQPGTIIDGRYIIEGILGQGGYSTVYACTHRVLERRLALKILDPLSVGEEAVEARFRLEARILSRLEHPNLVPVYDAGAVEGRPYLVMRRLEGTPLSPGVDSRWSVERAARLLVGALQGLALGHRQGIVHKDLKPENLVLEPETAERPERIVVTDFGMARETDSSDPITGRRSVTGTPQYLAPEYISEQRVTPALDVYQMALVLMELCAGRPVVEENSPYAAMMRHVQGDLELPAELAGHPIAPLLRRAISYDPADRFADAGAFASALERFVLTREPEREQEHGPPEAGVFLTASTRERIQADLEGLTELRGLIDGPRRVLVVDDDKEMRSLIRVVLEEVGLEVIEAANGVIGGQLTFSEQPDLVLCDQNMPRTTGLELISRLRKHSTTQRIPIILLTGERDPELRVAGLRVGADDFIIKPFSPPELVARVGALLRRLRTERTVDPVTKLPANLAVSTELAYRIKRRDEPFTFAVSILRDFEPYVSQYAFEATSTVVRKTAQVFTESVIELGQPSDFVGVLASNRFALVLEPSRSMDVISGAHQRFDEIAPRFYNREDRKQGFFRVKNGLLTRRVPLISLWTALIESTPENTRSEGTFARHIQRCLREMLDQPSDGESTICTF